MQLMQANTLAVMSRTDSATDVRRGNEGHRQAAAHWSTLTQTKVHHRLLEVSGSGKGQSASWAAEGRNLEQIPGFDKIREKQA